MVQTLSQHHRLHLLQSGLTDTIITQRGYYTVTTHQDLAALQFVPSQQRVPGLVIPLYRVDGKPTCCQLRPDTPRAEKRNGQARIIKYEMPAGQHMLLDVHPSQYLALGDPNVEIWITEGIKKADALASQGCCTIGLLGVWNWRGTNVKGGKTALPDWHDIALNGRRVNIVFDSDLRQNTQVARSATELQAYLRSKGASPFIILLPEALDGSKQGVDDFLAAGNTIDALRTFAHPHLPHQKPTREPLRRELPPSAPYPVDALGPVLAPMVCQLRAVVQAPEALCAQAVLAAAALAIQGHANVEIDGRVYPLSLFLVSIGESGERKSAVDHWALRVYKAYEQQLHHTYESECRTYKNQALAYKKAQEEALKKAKGYPDKQRDLATLGTPPEPPLKPFLTTEEPTFEGLIKLLLEGQPSMGLFTDEGGRFLGGHGMNTENQLKTAAGLCELWDGKRVTRVRSSEEAIGLYGRRLSMHIMAQPGVARLLINNNVFLDQGLLSRCLLAWPPSTVGTRSYQPINLSHNLVVQRYDSHMQQLLQADLRMASGTRNELAPHIVTLAPDAYQQWITYHNYVETQYAPNKVLAPIRGFACKAAEHVARMAGVLALVADMAATEVTRDPLERAIDLVEFYLAEALRLLHDAATPPEIKRAEHLLPWLQQFESVHLSQVYQYGPSNIRDAATARHTMQMLEAHGYVIPVEGGMVIDGTHRREAWEVVQ